MANIYPALLAIQAIRDVVTWHNRFYLDTFKWLTAQGPPLTKESTPLLRLNTVNIHKRWPRRNCDNRQGTLSTTVPIT